MFLSPSASDDNPMQIDQMSFYFLLPYAKIGPSIEHLFRGLHLNRNRHQTNLHHREK